MPTVADAVPAAILLSAGTASVSRSVTAGSSTLAYLQAAYALRARELATLSLLVDYSDDGRTESHIAHRRGLLEEMQILLELMSTPDAGTPWEFNQAIC